MAKKCWGIFCRPFKSWLAIPWTSQGPTEGCNGQCWCWFVLFLDLFYFIFVMPDFLFMILFFFSPEILYLNSVGSSIINFIYISIFMDCSMSAYLNHRVDELSSSENNMFSHVNCKFQCAFLCQVLMTNDWYFCKSL